MESYCFCQWLRWKTVRNMTINAGVASQSKLYNWGRACRCLQIPWLVLGSLTSYFCVVSPASRPKCPRQRNYSRAPHTTRHPPQEILDLRANLDGLERERDYYFRCPGECCATAESIRNDTPLGNVLQDSALVTKFYAKFVIAFFPFPHKWCWMDDSAVGTDLIGLVIARKLRDVEILCLTLKAALEPGSW